VKIGLAILHADPARGGAERYTIDIARALSHRGHDIHIMASSFSDEVPWELKQIKFECNAPGRTLRYRQFLNHFDQHILGSNYDVVHAMLPMRWCDVYHPHAGLAAQAMETGHEKHTGIAKPLAKFFNRFNSRRRMMARVERTLINSVKRPLVLCLSDAMKLSVRNYYPSLTDADLVTLMNAVDLQKFNPSLRPAVRDQTRSKLGLNKEHIVALIVAQDFERKGVGEAIMALPRARVPNLRLVVVGGDDPTEYLKLAAAWKVTDRVIFAGQTNDVFSFYRAADFFVLPTKHDPCSLALLEALGMGLPVISTRANGATEVMQEAIDGYILTDATRIDDLADLMRTLCDNRRRQTMSDAVMGHRAKFSFDHHLNLLLKIYQTAQSRRLRGMKE
jgi:UDP-glucose:(heptosyl)LPS alpha-1,3-glucosyltransferase